jgi:hypothetical protein
MYKLFFFLMIFPSTYLYAQTNYQTILGPKIFQSKPNDVYRETFSGHGIKPYNYS